jgi:hypothetical protein
VRREAPTLEEAAAFARAWLMARARRGFPDTAHVMRFPAWAGFSWGAKQQASDLFTRSVLAGVLLDIAELLEDDPVWQAALHDIARREADYIAGARLTDRAGGWSYFPALPELPPDLDSLAAAISLFARVAPEHLPLCERPIELALAGRRADGGLSTWLIAPEDPLRSQSRMRRAISRHWGDTTDAEICARFYAALQLADARKYADTIATGIRWLLTQQNADGSWPCSWYWSPAYAIELCWPLLRAFGDDHAELGLAVRCVLQQRRSDGGWGIWQSAPLDTGVALGVLCQPEVNVPHDVIANSVAVMCDLQTLEGYWKATPWIRMDIGRAQRDVLRSASYGNETLSTAVCLRALIQARRAFEKTGIF